LLETPKRVARSWSELYSGYNANAGDQLKWFEDNTDEMVVVRGVQFYSTCEHHMLPFFGEVDIAYIPNGAILGVSKLARLVEVYARRLQVQERLARQIGEALQDTKENAPLGVAVHMTGKHLCMMARGVKQQQAEMETNYLTGVFRTESATRAEFFARTK
jgi:GTP cyclohydrolase IA